MKNSFSCFNPQELRENVNEIQKFWDFLQHRNNIENFFFAEKYSLLFEPAKEKSWINNFHNQLYDLVRYTESSSTMRLDNFISFIFCKFGRATK